MLVACSNVGMSPSVQPCGRFTTPRESDSGSTRHADSLANTAQIGNNLDLSSFICPIHLLRSHHTNRETPGYLRTGDLGDTWSKERSFTKFWDGDIHDIDHTSLNEQPRIPATRADTCCCRNVLRRRPDASPCAQRRQLDGPMTFRRDRLWTLIFRSTEIFRTPLIWRIASKQH